MKSSAALCLLIPATLQLFATSSAPAKDLDWQPEKTWVFVVGVLSWKHSETFGSFPVKNRRDAALVDFFKQSGVSDSQIVYLQDKEATQQRIESDFTEQLKKLGPDDLLVVYYAGHGSKSDDGNDVYLASYDAGDDGADGWSINSNPGENQKQQGQPRPLVSRLLLLGPGRAGHHQTIERPRLCVRDFLGGERIFHRALDFYRGASGCISRRFLRRPQSRRRDYPGGIRDSR